MHFVKCCRSTTAGTVLVGFFFVCLFFLMLQHHGVMMQGADFRHFHRKHLM